MSITLNSWVARSVEMALVGVNNEASYIETAEMLAETLIPQVAQATVRDAAGDPNRFQQTLQTITLTFTDGIATIPSNVLTEFLPQATVDDPADPDAGKYSSWVKNFQDFRNTPDPLLGYFTCNPMGQMYYSSPGTPWESGGTNFDGDLDVTIPCDITLTTNPDAVITISPELEDAMVTNLASAIQSSGAWANLTTRLEVPGDES